VRGAPAARRGRGQAEAIRAAEEELWLVSASEHRSATLTDVFERAGHTPTEEFLASYTRAWEPHTFTDPDAASVSAVAARPRDQDRRAVQHDVAAGLARGLFRRDGVLDLIDGAVYSSEIDWAKPHPRRSARPCMRSGPATARCVFIGDRPYGRRARREEHGDAAILIPHSSVPSYDGTERTRSSSGWPSCPPCSSPGRPSERGAAAWS
jgi:putative hydrolase of the HAD superfamily